MKKRILSMFLAALMIIGSVGTFTFVSAEDYTDPTFAVEAGEIQPDGTVNVKIVLYNNPGIAGYNLKVYYDTSVLRPVRHIKADVKSEFKSYTTNIGRDEAIEEGYISCMLASESNIVDENDGVTLVSGCILSAVFEIIGDFEKTVLDLRAEAGDITDEAFANVEFDLIDGEVALPEIEGVTLAGAEYTYDGTAKKLEVAGATGDMVVTYSPETVTNAGTHKVTATVKQPGYQTLTLEADLKINPANLTVSGVTATDKVYDATDKIVIDSSAAVLNGVKGDDKVTVKFPAEGTIANANAGADLTVTYTAPTLEGADAGNYTVTAPTLTATVNKRIVTVTPDAGQNKKVGAADPVLTYKTNFDVTTLGASLSGDLTREPGEDGGEISKTYKILMGTLACSDANIELVLADEVFTINNKDPQTVQYNVPSDTDEFVYNPETDPTFPLEVNVTNGITNPTITYESSDESVVTVDENGVVTMVGAGTANVTIKVAGDATWAEAIKVVSFTVEPKEVVVTPVAGTATYGDDIDITVNYEGNDEFEVTGEAALASTGVGEQAITVGSLAIANKNYELVFTTGVKYTITAKTVNVAGIVFWPTVKGELPEFFMFNPYVSEDEIVGDDVVNVIVAPDYAVVDNDGKYYVTGISSDNENYVLNTEVTNNITWVDTVNEQAGVIADAFDEGYTEVTSGQESLDVDAMNEALPGDLTLVIKETNNESIIDKDGNIVPDSSDAVVNVTFEIYNNGVSTGETFTISVFVPKEVSDARLLALLYYMYTKNQTLQQVESVRASVASGEVASGTKVTLSSATAGTTIYYTTNGSTPTVLSKVYTGAIEITDNVTITAIATKNGMKTSAPVSFTYTVDDTSIVLKDNADEIKYMEGRGDKFEADANATRYEVVAALANVFNIVTSNDAKALTDVDADYKAVVDLFTAAGIIDGYTDNTFRGDKEIKRAEVAKIICVMMGLDVEGAKDAGFTDSKDHWAAAYINACAEAEYVQGKGDNRFAPDEYITRAQLATLINNITGAVDGTECVYDDVNKDAWYFGAVAAAAK